MSAQDDSSRPPPRDDIYIGDVIIIETSDFPEANDDGAITVPADAEQALVEYEPASGDSRAHIHALGATDAQDVEYRVRYGGEEIAWTTESPLGGINDPFSFTKEFGRPLTAGGGTIQLTALNASDQPIDLVGRLYVEVL